MLDFDIRFIDSQNFEFLDLSDYTGLTVLSTELRVFASNPISTETFDTIPLLPTTEIITDVTVVNLQDFALKPDNLTDALVGAQVSVSYPAVEGDVFSYTGRYDSTYVAANFYDSLGNVISSIIDAGEVNAVGVDITCPAGTASVRFCSTLPNLTLTKSAFEYVLGDDILVDLLETGSTLTVLYDNIYQMSYYVTTDTGEQFVTKFLAKTVDLEECRRKLVRGLVNTPEGSVYCKACDANYFDSALSTIDDYLVPDLYKEAELLIADLKETCKICDC